AFGCTAGTGGHHAGDSPQVGNCLAQDAAAAVVRAYVEDLHGYAQCSICWPAPAASRCRGGEPFDCGGQVAVPLCLGRLRQDLACPVGQLFMNAVIDPLAAPLVLHQAAGAQFGQVPGDLGLAFPECLRQVTDAQLLVQLQEQQGLQARVVGQALEEGG